MTVVRAIWLKQPYASLMLHGKIETRFWPTRVRGPVLICASKEPYSEKEVLDISGAFQKKRIDLIFPDYAELPTGCSIGYGDLIDSKRMQSKYSNQCFVDFDIQLHMHIYKDVKEVEPFPIKGCQGWRILDQPTIEKIKFKETPSSPNPSG